MFGGFEDERKTSEDITETLLSVMQVSTGIMLHFNENTRDLFVTPILYIHFAFLHTLQALNARFRLVLACTGPVNTVIKAGVAWPRVYGAGVSLDTGQVFSAQFAYHGPDTDIR